MNIETCVWIGSRWKERESWHCRQRLGRIRCGNLGRVCQLVDVDGRSQASEAAVLIASDRDIFS